jgi:hypothetical protein
LDSTGSRQVPVAGFGECSDELSGSYATELVNYTVLISVHILTSFFIYFRTWVSSHVLCTITSWRFELRLCTIE